MLVDLLVGQKTISEEVGTRGVLDKTAIKVIKNKGKQGKEISY